MLPHRRAIKFCLHDVFAPNFFSCARRHIGVRTFTGDMLGLFRDTSRKNDPKEVSNLRTARKHVPEAVEEVEVRKKIESNVRNQIATMRTVLENLQKGESPLDSWGHVRDFLCMIGIDPRILHEKPLMHLMGSLSQQGPPHNPLLAKLTAEMFHLLALLEEHPLLTTKHAVSHGIEPASISAYNAGIGKVLCALGIAADDLGMHAEAQSVFDFAKKFCRDPMQVAGILSLEASMLNKAKRFNAACSVAREAIRKSNQTNCMAFYHAAHALAAMGSTAEAIATIESGLSTITDSRRGELVKLKERLAGK